MFKQSRKSFNQVNHGSDNGLRCKHPNRLVLETTNRYQARLNVVVPACVTGDVEHCLSVGVAATVKVAVKLTGTPPEASDTDSFENTI